MAILFANNATSNLAASLTAGASSLTVTTGDGALFPSPTGSDYFLATISEGSTIEIVKVTARSSDTFTITRAQESTSAAAFSTTATVELRLTAGIMSGISTSSLLPYAVGDTLYASSTTALSKLAIGSAGHVLTVNSGATAPSWALSGVHGQCRLTKSGSNLLLSPLGGNKIIVNSVVQSIPDAGVSLVPTGLTPGTAYLIYAYMSGSTLTLEASTTAHATQTGTGVEIKSGDATRTLVGWVAVQAGPAFADTAAQRLVMSWFNRRHQVAANAFTANRTTTSTSWTEVNSEIRAEFGTWDDEAVWVTIGGRGRNDTVNEALNTIVGIDSTSTASGVGASSDDLPANAITATSAVAGTLLSEGYHYATLLGSVTAGTGTWFTSGAAATGTGIRVLVRI